MGKQTHIQTDVTIKFAGDSGDGMQLTGNLFTDNTALVGSDLATFPDFPAEIRAPQGTLAGVSGFQLHFGSREIDTPGDQCDVLVAMNAAALRANLTQVRPRGTIIANEDGFDSRNLRLAGYPDGALPLEQLDGYELIRMQVTRLTREALRESPLSTKEKDRCKNMFVLGFLYWRYNRELAGTELYLREKFGRSPEILDANLAALRAGYNYGDTVEAFTVRYEVKAAPLPSGRYRNIMGNQALELGLVAASKQSGLPLFYGSYPITPASDILHGLSRYKNFGVRTFQAEDEIAAIGATIGAAYGGSLAVTGTSGPGMALKTEAMGLAMMLELPLVIVNVQRGGPSTGLPTKTEQADLLQALYGRNGECPMPVLATRSPADCFDVAFEAARIAVQHMTPVILLSDGYIANGAEPWRFPQTADLPRIEVRFAEPVAEGETFLPYARDERLVRTWALPGTPGLTHRIGGLEKQDGTGNVSYDPANHQRMIELREAKVDRIADFIPEQTIEVGPDAGDLLVLGWGSTYGVIRSTVRELADEGMAVAHAHLRYIRPLPRNLGDLLRRYRRVLVPELNRGQLARVIRDTYLIPVEQYNKVQGVPISKTELRAQIEQVLRQG
ncbi:MAG: 2-oxoacid:acceptor oxidoreductase subunit alpha [Bacteroidia bacterium]